jgi:WD40 repeat protein
VATDPRTLVIWDTTSGEALAYWTTPSAVLDVALVPGGRNVFMGLKDHSAVLFDAERGDHLRTFLHDGVVGSVDVSSDGKWALTGSEDETAVLWNLADGSAVHTFQHSNPVRVVALSGTGRYTFTAARGQLVAIWDGSEGTRLHTLSERNDGVTTARFSTDERYLLLGYVNRRIELWDVVTGQRVQRWSADPRTAWRASGGATLAVGFSQSPRTFYALAGDGQLVELHRG